MALISTRPQRAIGQPRPLRSCEREIVEFLLASSLRCEGLALKLAGARVNDLDDGAQGGIVFVPEDERPRSYDCPLAIGEFVDDDLQQVSIALNLDQYGELYELDIWKPNPAGLVRYPRACDLIIKRRVSSRSAQLFQSPWLSGAGVTASSLMIAAPRK